MTSGKTKQVSTSGAVIYTRVSTGEQDKHGTSPETQRDACRQKAQALGLPIVAEYHDGGISGGFLLTRAGVQSALADINTGRADTLICANISRYSRDVEHQQAIKKAVKSAGGRLVFCDMDFDDTPEGDLAFGIMGGFAEYEKAVIKTRTVGGRIKKAEQGIQPARTSSPLGYHIVSKPDVLGGKYPLDTLGTYLIVDAEAVLVRGLFADYAAGATLPGLARRLNDSGVPTRKGGKFWRPSTLRCILTNPVYKGLGAYGKTNHYQDEARIGSLSERSGKTLTTSSFVRPADPAAWMVQNRRQASGNPHRVRMLAGRILCPECGAGLTVTHHLIGGQLKHGGQRVPAYICGKYQDKMISTGHRGCLPTSYPLAAVEDAVHLALLDAMRNPRAIANALAAYQEAFPSPAIDEPCAESLARVTRELNTLQKKQAAAVQAQIAGIMAGADPSAYSAVFAEIAAECQVLEEKQRRFSISSHKQPARQNAPAPATDIGKILADMCRVLRSPGVANTEKRRVLGTVLTQVTPAKDKDGQRVRVEFLPNALPIPQETLQSFSFCCPTLYGGLPMMTVIAASFSF